MQSSLGEDTHNTHKGLVSRIYKELLQINNKMNSLLKTNGQENWAGTSQQGVSKWGTNIKKVLKVIVYQGNTH